MKEITGSVLRSTAQFFAMFFTYVVARGILWGIIFPIENGNGLLFSYEWVRFVWLGFLSLGSVMILAALIYRLFAPINSKPNYKVIIPLLLIMVGFCEMFLF